jgi:hypothetical protein
MIIQAPGRRRELLLAAIRDEAMPLTGAPETMTAFSS